MRIKTNSEFSSTDQTSIPGVNQVFAVLEWNLIFVLLSKILDRLKRLFVVRIPRVTVYWEMRNIYVSQLFVGAVTKSKWGGLVWELKNRCRQKLWSTLENCTMIQTRRTPSRGIIWRFFSIFEGMKKFYYRHSVKKCTKYPFDSRAHLKTVRRLWFLISDRLETWLILSGTTRSKLYHESTMVWRNLPSYHLW